MYLLSIVCLFLSYVHLKISLIGLEFVINLIIDVRVNLVNNL